MKNKIQISIPTPCHENWQNMTVTEKGRFCASCQKNVIDFTKLSDREIVNAFEKDINTCGRFNESQLNRELFVPKEKSAIWIAAASGLLAFLGLGNQNIYAQQKTELSINDKTSPGSENDATRTITGTVRDKEITLPGVMVAINGTNRTTQTDFDGMFSIKANTGEKLSVTYDGMKNIEVIIDDKSFFDIQMEELPLEAYIDTDWRYKIAFNDKFTGKNMSRDLTGIGVPIKARDLEDRKKRTFFGRIFHSIGNLFR